MELNTAVELFLSNQRPTTRESYRYVLRLLTSYLGPARPLEDIKPTHLIEYQHQLDKRNYAVATYNKHIKTIKTMFNWFVAIEELERSPARPLRRKRQEMYITRDKAMTDEELAKLLDYALNHPRKTLLYRTRDYALILFLADTGCRIGGAAGLQVKDVDLEQGRAKVTEKGDKSRPVHFGRLCSVALARLMLMKHSSADAYLFSTGVEPMKADNISLMIRRMCKQLNIRPLSGHSLRHRKGHQFADEKIAPSIAATALGHSSPIITLQHYYPADWATAEKFLDQFAVTADLKPAADPKKPIDLLDFIRRAAGG